MCARSQIGSRLEPEPTVFFILALILALIFLPWPWNLVVIAAGGGLRGPCSDRGHPLQQRRRAQVGVQTMIGSDGRGRSRRSPRRSGQGRRRDLGGARRGAGAGQGHRSDQGSGLTSMWTGPRPTSSVPWSRERRPPRSSARCRTRSTRSRPSSTGSRTSQSSSRTSRRPGSRCSASTRACRSPGGRLLRGDLPDKISIYRGRSSASTGATRRAARADPPRRPARDRPPLRDQRREARRDRPLLTTTKKGPHATELVNIIRMKRYFRSAAELVSRACFEAEHAAPERYTG